MSSIRFDKTGRSELFYSVSGKAELQNKRMTEITSKKNKNNYAQRTFQSKAFFEKSNFNGYEEEINLNEMKELKETNIPLKESIE